MKNIKVIGAFRNQIMDYVFITSRISKQISLMVWVGGGQFIVVVPSLNAVIAINQNIADENAIKQSIAFQEQVFPIVFNMLKH
jgi:hypothetical protein